MLKGTMKIELTDVHSGETETVLEQNMVTNALSEIFKPLGLAKSPNKLLQSFAPYYQNLLGGILLFDSSIEENEQQLFPNANNKLIGCGSYGVQNNTTGTLRGGYNQTESEFNAKDRFMKFVYDFTTSQANGTIASVCLTHKSGGFTSYGGADAVFDTTQQIMQQVCDSTLQYVCTSYTGALTADKYNTVSIGTNEYIFAIDRVNDVVLYFRIDSVNNISIVKRRAYLKSVSVLVNPYSQKQLVEEIELPAFSTAMLTYRFAYNYDHDDNALYIFSSSSNTIAVGASYLITKISLTNWNVTQYTMVNTSDSILSADHGRFAYAHRGFVYLKGYSSPYNIYKFKIGTAANVVKLSMNGVSTVTGVPQLGINGRIYFDNAGGSSVYSLVIANESTNEALKSEASRLFATSNYHNFTPVLNEPMLYYMSYGSSNLATGFVMMSNYLATINNLTEPVTKTADKTMKITYIIQEQ